MSVEELIDPDENDSRYKLGRKAGRFDKGSDLDNDMIWLTQTTPKKVARKGGGSKVIETSFQELDPVYCRGYERGYEEGLQPGDNLEKMF